MQECGPQLPALQDIREIAVRQDAAERIGARCANNLQQRHDGPGGRPRGMKDAHGFAVDTHPNCV